MHCLRNRIRGVTAYGGGMGEGGGRERASATDRIVMTTFSRQNFVGRRARSAPRICSELRAHRTPAAPANTREPSHFTRIRRRRRFAGYIPFVFPSVSRRRRAREDGPATQSPPSPIPEEFANEAGMFIFVTRRYTECLFSYIYF